MLTAVAISENIEQVSSLYGLGTYISWLLVTASALLRLRLVDRTRWIPSYAAVVPFLVYSGFATIHAVVLLFRALPLLASLAAQHSLVMDCAWNSAMAVIRNTLTIYSLWGVIALDNRENQGYGHLYVLVDIRWTMLVPLSYLLLFNMSILTGPQGDLTANTFILIHSLIHVWMARIALARSAPLLIPKMSRWERILIQTWCISRSLMAILIILDVAFKPSQVQSEKPILHGFLIAATFPILAGCWILKAPSRRDGKIKSLGLPGSLILAHILAAIVHGSIAPDSVVKLPSWTVKSNSHITDLDQLAALLTSIMISLGDIALPMISWFKAATRLSEDPQYTNTTHWGTRSVSRAVHRGENFRRYWTYFFELMLGANEVSNDHDYHDAFVSDLERRAEHSS